MAAFNKTQTVTRFFLIFAAAAAAAVGLVYFFAGPRLGPHYDFLLRYRPAPPLSHELVLIETGNSGNNASGRAAGMVEPGAVTSVLMTCTELGASALVLQAPVLGLTSGGGSARDKLLDRFNAEFTLLEGNIKNLFQAIRMGSVAPAESERYVGDLIGLTERGKERLIAALEQRDHADILLMEKAAAAYGSLWEAGDLSLSAARPPWTLASELKDAAPRYGKPQPDGDGVFRRIAPVLTDEAGTEHIVYALLKQRYDTAGIEDTETGPALMLAKNGENIFLPLDARGALLPELPREEDFRRIPLETVLDYERQDSELYRALTAAETMGFFAEMPPEEYPTAWYRYAQELREDLLEKPGKENRLRWLDARAGYFNALDNYIQGPWEDKIIMGYERLIASKSLGSAGIGRVVSQRNDFIKNFEELQKQYEDFKVQREELRTALESSLGILGPRQAPGSRNPSDAEISAILANTILTGRALVPQANRYILVCALAGAFIIALCLCRLSPSSGLLTGLFLTVLVGLFFSWGFIVTGYWMDPLIPAGAMAAGVLAAVLTGLRIQRQQAALFRRAYEPVIAPAYLREVIQAGKPLPEDIIKAKAGIVAIRGAGLMAAESRGDPRESARKIAEFREKVAEFFKNAGATLTGFEGDMALVVFGSPLERIALQGMNKEMPYEDDARARGSHTPISKAAGFIIELLRTVPDTASWYFGLDTGEAAFTYSAMGYTVSGPPVVRARILSGLAPRYKARILITGRVYEKIDAMPIRQLDVLSARDGKSREPFYELIVKPGR